ncbi:MAG TPA: hypothetical protein VF332_07525 [Vicinamibacterales bacterium]
MRTTVARLVSFLVAFFLLPFFPSVALAQDSKSMPLAKELAQLLDQDKLDAIAAKDPAAPDAFVAALYYAGSQLLVVSARYAVPPILMEKVAKKDFREVYTDLNSAAIEGSRTLVMDIGADGLKPKKEDSRFDTCDVGAKSYVFDGDWKKQKLASEDEYTTAFAAADAKYAKMLTALIAQVKKGK